MSAGIPPARGAILSVKGKPVWTVPLYFKTMTGAKAFDISTEMRITVPIAGIGIPPTSAVVLSEEPGVPVVLGAKRNT
jgi:hypothetical protein